MQYQVVARTCLPHVGKWDYFPYLVPSRDKAAAERLARYAAQNGCEAAVLQSVTIEMVVCIARALVERQDESLLPTLRYKPGVRQGEAELRLGPALDLRFSVSISPDPYFGGPDKAALDARRLFMEMGPGGDVDAGGSRRGQRLSFPQRLDVVGTWLRLRERVVLGQMGGPGDGADDEANVEDAN